MDNIIKFMSKVTEKALDLWNWPLSSEFVKSAEDKKSLRAWSDSGSAIGGIVIFPAITMYLQSNNAVMLSMALFSVLAGFYVGSAAWKINRHMLYNL
jgi:hypothetical protein